MNAKRMIALGVGAALVLAAPVLLFAHAVVFPRASTPGAFERYVLRVPNEKSVATTKVELRVPAGVRVTSFADVPGWKLEVRLDSANAIAGAVWTGILAPKRFVEFPFMAANPKTDTVIRWPAIQSYADGMVVEWTGPDSSKTPASVTRIAAPPSAADSGSGAGAPSWPAWSALVIAIVALGLALRRPAPTG